MNIDEARKKILIVKEKMLEMQDLTKIERSAFEELDEHGQPNIDPGWHMDGEFPEEDAKVKACWRIIQENVPSGFSVDGNLIRHLHFNQANDWHDISFKDIPRELIKLEEYIGKLNLVAYIDTLHPEIARVSQTLLDGDYDAAVKTVFASFESKIRNYLKLSPTDSAFPAIGKAFKDGKMTYTVKEYNDSVRNFLQGVVGFYRSMLIHNPLPASRNNMESCLSLFALAHEAYLLLDDCINQ